MTSYRWWRWPLIWWRQWRCHHEFEFECNIYGDDINRASLKHTYRSWWVCFKCGKIEGRGYLVNQFATFANEKED